MMPDKRDPIAKRSQMQGQDTMIFTVVLTYPAMENSFTTIEKTDLRR
jgi:hypothetical protein